MHIFFSHAYINIYQYTYLNIYILYISDAQRFTDSFIKMKLFWGWLCDLPCAPNVVYSPLDGADAWQHAAFCRCRSGIRPPRWKTWCYNGDVVIFWTQQNWMMKAELVEASEGLGPWWLVAMCPEGLVARLQGKRGWWPNTETGISDTQNKYICLLPRCVRIGFRPIFKGYVGFREGISTIDVAR